MGVWLSDERDANNCTWRSPMSSSQFPKKFQSDSHGWPQIYTSSTRKLRNGATALSSCTSPACFNSHPLWGTVHASVFTKEAAVSNSVSPPVFPDILNFNLYKFLALLWKSLMHPATISWIILCAKSAWDSLSLPWAGQLDTFCEALSTDPEQTAPSHRS